MIGTDAHSRPTSIETNVAAVRRFWDGFNAHTLAVWDEVCAATFVNHDPGLPTPDADLPTIKQAIGGLFAAFPDPTGKRSSSAGLCAAPTRVSSWGSARRAGP